ncbi:MAG TPA: FG-GAP repeat protein [Actinomycetota bacterium]|jgi:hypothetical protein
MGRALPRRALVASIGGALCALFAATSAVNAAPRPQFEAAAAAGHPSLLLGRSSALSGGLLVAGGTTAAGKGAVFIFRRPKGGWHDVTPVAILTLRNEPAGDGFGVSVATDGSTIIVGAPETTVRGHTNAGAAYVYARPPHGWASTSHPTARLTDSSPADSDFVGGQVGVSGRTALVGAANRDVGSQADAGAGLIFVEPPQGWATRHQTAVLTSSTATAADQTGIDVAISGTRVVLGSRAGDALVFVRPHSGWADATETRRLGPGTPSATFGQGVAINGTTVAVGDPGYTGSHISQGAVYVFQRPAGSGWGGGTSTLTPKARLTAADGEANDAIGSVLAVGYGIVVAGSPSHDVGTAQEQGVAYAWHMQQSGWHDSDSPRELVAADGRQFDEFGSSVAANGRTVGVGAPFADNPNIANDDSDGVEYVFP